jgi:hypothetical protein
MPTLFLSEQQFGLNATLLKLGFQHLYCLLFLEYALFLNSSLAMQMEFLEIWPSESPNSTTKTATVGVRHIKFCWDLSAYLVLILIPI